jgi:hypothetical protein
MACVLPIGPEHKHSQKPVRQVFRVWRAKTPVQNFIKEPVSNHMTWLGVWAKILFHPADNRIEPVLSSVQRKFGIEPISNQLIGFGFWAMMDIPSSLTLSMTGSSLIVL